MAENVLLAEQRFEGFALNSEYGAYAYDIYPAPASLVLGETYTVVWDGVAYACPAQDVSFLLPGGIGLGNLADFGGIGNGEPFVIGWLNPSDGSGGGVTLFSFDTQLAHTAAVHQVVADETLPGIVLEDFNGNDSVHNKDRVMFDTSDGGTQIFSKGEAVDGVVIPLDLSEGHQTVTAPAGTLVRSATILKPDTLTPDNIKSGVEVAGVVGTLTADTEEVTVELDMAEGDQVIEPSEDGKALSRVTVKKPETLISDNIKKGVSIAGVNGTYAPDNMPKLYAPTGISSYLTQNPGYLTILNNTSKNGAFPQKARILFRAGESAEYEVVAEATMTAAGNINIYGKDFNRPVMMAQATAQYGAEGFIDSDTYFANSVIYSVFRLLYDLVGVSLDKNDGFAFHSDRITYHLVAQESYYLPKAVDISEISIEGKPMEPDYTYDPDTGELIINGGNVVESKTIKIHAVQTPWLRNPVLPIDDSNLTLTVEKVDENATETKVFVDGAHALSVADEREGMLSWEVTDNFAYLNSQSYYFTLRSNGKYRSNCTARFSWAIVRVTFNMITEATIQIGWTRYLTNYSSTYNSGHAQISKIDTDLPRSGSVTNDAVYVYCGDGRYAATVSGTTNMTIPAGTHFIEFKFYNSVASSSYFEFSIDTECAENTQYDMTEYLPTYGEYTVQAQSYADGYTESDLMTLGYNYRPVFEVNNDVLTITNHVPSGVSSFAIYVNGELKGTVAYDSTTDFSVDMTAYDVSMATGYYAYVVGIGDGVPENQSDELWVETPPPYYSVGDVSGATYGFVWSESLGYYISNNWNISESAAVCKVTFNTQGGHLYLDCVNYAEGNYDYGILSKIDTTLGTTNAADSNYFKSFKGASSTAVQTVDYGAVEAGEHFIYVKFLKDSSGNSGNDRLYFKVRFE